MDKLKRGMFDVFFANILSLILGLVTGFIMPRLLSVDTYASIKTYQLYVSYIGFLHLGFVDGIYLRYGGDEYSSIKTQQLKNTHGTLAAFQMAVAIGTLLFGALLKDDALLFFAISVLPLNMLNFYKNMYQATGEFGRYKNILKWNTILTFIMVVFLLGVFQTDNYLFFFWGYTAINFAVWLGTEKKAKIAYLSVKYFDLKELISEIKSGLFLMLGNFSSILLTSMDRWFIKAFLDTLAFAEYSFAVSMENLLNVAITPVTTTLYNFFCNNNEHSKVTLIRRYVTIFAAAVAASAFPVNFIIENFLGKYEGAAKVLFLLFAGQILYVPIKGVYVNLYKVEKKQSLYFRSIVVIVIAGAALNGLLYLLLGTKEAFAIGTLLSALLWYLICCFDFRKLDLPIKEIIYSVIEILSFVTLGWICTPILGFTIYVAGTICISFFVFREEMKGLIAMLMGIFTNKAGKQ